MTATWKYDQLVGGTFVALGTWSFLEESSQLSLIKVSSVKDILFNISLALTLIGCIVFSMSFAGCLGALRENLCLLKLVSIISILIVIFVMMTMIFLWCSIHSCYWSYSSEKSYFQRWPLYFQTHFHTTWRKTCPKIHYKSIETMPTYKTWLMSCNES